MALTRKMLKAMGIDDEKIEQIVDAHTETVDALKEQIESAKVTVDTDLSEKLKLANDKIAEMEKEDYKSQFEKVKKEFDDYKTDVSLKAVKLAKENAYKELLKKVNISEKRIDTVLKVTDLSKVELDKDGKIIDSESLEKSIKDEWADFVVEVSEQGQHTVYPPKNSNGDGFSNMSLAEKMAYANEHPASSEVKTFLEN